MSELPLTALMRSANANGNERPNLSIVLGDKRTATAQTIIAVDGFRLECLADALRGVSGDHITFETAPSASLMLEAAIYTADWLLIPGATDGAAVEGLAGIVATRWGSNGRG